MTRKSLEDAVKCLLDAQQGFSPKNVNIDTRVYSAWQIDSLDAVELVMAIEDEFDLEILDSEFEGFDTDTTFGQLVQFVEQKIASVTKAGTP